jgi:hypothetical protein
LDVISCSQLVRKVLGFRHSTNSNFQKWPDPCGRGPDQRRWDEACGRRRFAVCSDGTLGCFRSRGLTARGLAPKGLHRKTDARQRAWSYPEEIESAILVVEGVAAARVYGKPDPSYGEIVAANLVVNAEFEAADVLKRVRNTLESSLAKCRVPKILNSVDAIN